MIANGTETRPENESPACTCGQHAQPNASVDMPEDIVRTSERSRIFVQSWTESPKDVGECVEEQCNILNEAFDSLRNVYPRMKRKHRGRVFMGISGLGHSLPDALVNIGAISAEQGDLMRSMLADAATCILKNELSSRIVAALDQRYGDDTTGDYRGYETVEAAIAAREPFAEEKHVSPASQTRIDLVIYEQTIAEEGAAPELSLV